MHCGNSIYQDIAYLSAANFYGGKNFVCERINEEGFYAGIICKTHFRLVEIAVKKDAQGKGLGKYMMKRMISLSKKCKLKKITLRTRKKDTAIHFYERFGAKVTGVKDDDYEMEILTCFI